MDLLAVSSMAGNALAPHSWGQVDQNVQVLAWADVQRYLSNNGHCLAKKQPLEARSISQGRDIHPPLPLPGLNDTLDALVKMSAIEGDTEKVAAFKKKVQLFRETSAKELQCVLEEKAKPEHEPGWLSELWGEMYNGIRLAAPGNVSFALELNSHEWRCRSKMAHAVLATCEYHQNTSGKTPSSLNQAESLFNNHKPGIGADHLQPCKTSPEQHIVVFSKQQIYKIPIANREGRLVSYDWLAEQLEALQTLPDQHQESTDITPLTAVNRDQCARLQQQFAMIEANGKLIEAIDDAFCCVCFDIDPNTDSASRQILAGNGDNRCFDKALQFIQLADDRIGVTIEHTPGDAGAWLPLFKYINDWSTSQKPSDSAFRSEPEQLIPEIDDQLVKDINSARKSFQGAINDIELRDIVIDGVDREAIKKCGFRPDAFHQMVFQVAADKAGYSYPAVYESVSMSKFKYGRTEALRSRSPESMALIDALNNPDLPDNKKRECLINAAKAHSKEIGKCQEGNGICRHLFALEKIWESLYQGKKDHSKPELFTDPLYLDLIKKNTLSTSCVADSNISRFVFGPVEDDGLGIAYYPTTEALRVSVSWKRENRRGLDFVKVLEPAARELLRLLGIGSSESSIPMNFV